MPLRFFNTYSRSLEEFQSRAPGAPVKIYTCGPTVYSYAHIGNFRAYIFEDLLQRHLEYHGHRVERVMNLTDVDDKTIRGCRAAGISLDEFTRPFKDAFFADLAELRIKQPDYFPAATEPVHIARMIAMIGLLLERGYAYQAEDHSIYFRLSKFPNYGQLAHLNLDELRPSGRVRSDEYDKENLGDFALWKAWDEQDGAVAWESPWGRGRPGWHIECSAMAIGLLGDELDFHCGAVDNIFPHHEAEIAQSEACTGKQFARFWLHCAHLIVDGQKMAKSLGNFYTLRDLLARGFTGRELRYTLLSVNYRLPLNFTFDSVLAARGALHRLDAWVQRLAENVAAPSDFTLPQMAAFDDALDDDLNISGALGQLFELVRLTNRALDEQTLPPAAAAAVLAWWQRVDQTLQLARETAEIPPEVLALVAQREAARVAKQWSESDRLRAEIEAAGWHVKDTKDGSQLSRRLPGS